MQNAHYTAPGIRSVIWDSLVPSLREKDKVLDPGCGIGGFYIEMPKDLNLSYVGVEKDAISSAIAKCAHPEANIYHKDFLKWSYPQKFNLVIGNVPFTNGVSTMEVDGKRLRIGLHAQFFVRAVAHLAPRGLLAFLTSVSTLDARTPDYLEFREWVHRKCEFLGAVRLPNQGTHQGSTEVTTDLILLRRRESVVDTPASLEWINVGKSHIVGYDGAPAFLSNWYLANPQYLIGEPVANQLRGKNGNPATTFALHPRPNQDVLGELKEKLNLILNKETIMATVIPADKFEKNSIYSFILRENPEKKGIEIHFPPECKTDNQNAIAFIAKIMGAGFKQANKNSKLYYANYTSELMSRARSWVESCKTQDFGAYELSPNEAVDKTPSRRRYNGSSTKEVVSTPATPNKLLDAISSLLDNKVDPLAQNIASLIVERLKSERRDSQELDSLKVENALLISERDALLKSSEDISQTLANQKEKITEIQESWLESEKRNEMLSGYCQDYKNAIAKLHQECDGLRKQLQEFGLEPELEPSPPKFDDDSQPMFADESEGSESIFADESTPKFDDEEEGFDLDALQEK